MPGSRRRKIGRHDAARGGGNGSSEPTVDSLIAKPAARRGLAVATPHDGIDKGEEAFRQ